MKTYLKGIQQKTVDVVKQQNEKILRPCGGPTTAVVASLGLQPGHAGLGILSYGLINFEIYIYVYNL